MESEIYLTTRWRPELSENGNFGHGEAENNFVPVGESPFIRQIFITFW